jgi:hypothetical protein
MRHDLFNQLADVVIEPSLPDVGSTGSHAYYKSHLRLPTGAKEFFEAMIRRKIRKIARSIYPELTSFPPSDFSNLNASDLKFPSVSPHL